jgi:protein-tyrosine phosphatase
VQSVLFVCLGNICRSPLAQGIFERQAIDAGIASGFNADSAGTSGWHEGEPPHSGSIQIARKYGISIDRQRSRPVHAKDGEIFDFIVAMDNQNMDSLLHEFRFPKDKIFLMRDFSVVSPGKRGLAVPDPWGHGKDAFEEVYTILNESMQGFISYLKGL